MDMTMGPSLGDIAHARVSRLASSPNRVLSGFAAAALRIDAGEFAQAQTILLTTINDFAHLGADVSNDAADAIRATLGSIDGHRYQTGVLRSCLETVHALHINPRATSMGERVGRMQHALGVLMAHRSMMAKAA